MATLRFINKVIIATALIFIAVFLLGSVGIKTLPDKIFTDGGLIFMAVYVAYELVFMQD